MMTSRVNAVPLRLSHKQLHHERDHYVATVLREPGALAAAEVPTHSDLVNKRLDVEMGLNDNVSN